VNQPIKQPTTFMKWSTAGTQARSRLSWEPSLRQEECSRSSYLGEIATVSLKVSRALA